MSKHLLWNCSTVVRASVETELLESLKLQEEDMLHRRLIGELPMPLQPQMSEYQIVNLLRQVLREKMGEERFNAMTVLGTLEGQKAAGDMFESIVEAYLRANHLRFQTENELRAVKPKGPKTSRAAAAAWRQTSNVDSQGRKLFSGPCCVCGAACECPFKPIVGREGPQCRACFRNLTPDFILQEDVFINGQKVCWIDCKCYYGSASMGIHGKTSLQRVSQDYSKMWGPGAVIFAFGFCESFALDGVLLLDASPLDMAPLDELLYNAPFRQLWRKNNSALTADK